MAVFHPCSSLLRRISSGISKRGYASKMILTFCSANHMFYHDVAVNQIDVPSFSGCFGILSDHVPTLALLRPGVVNVLEEDGKTNKIFVSSGIVTVNEDSTVNVLAEEAHPLEDLDVAAAKEVLTKSQTKLLSATTDEARAEAEIAVEVGEALVQALQ